MAGHSWAWCRERKDGRREERKIGFQRVLGDFSG